MKTSSRRLWIAGLGIALVVALLSPLASPHPDGLERVAEDQGFLERAADAPYHLIADYLFPGISNEAAATILAGIVGTLLVFGITWGLAAALRRRQGAQKRA
ncbi:MAG: PDGLE domain-containing protein [Chloroflexi bacterium]|nr:PDGLE domain-containing protein [Chloroflexota bacterium]